jgi:hypothetical protein
VLAALSLGPPLFKNDIVIKEKISFQAKPKNLLQTRAARAASQISQQTRA